MRRIALLALLAVWMALPGCGLTGFLDREHTAYCAHNPSAAQCAEDVPFSVQFYAAIGDYNAAKSATVAYVEAPSTPIEHVESILLVVEEADAVMERVNEARLAGDVTPDLYAEGAHALRRAIGYLRAYVVGQIPVEDRT